MKTVIMVIQHENWEEVGGNHDPAIYCMDDKTFNELKALHDEDDPVEGDDLDKVLWKTTILVNPVFPISIDAIFNIWWK